MSEIEERVAEAIWQAAGGGDESITLASEITRCAYIKMARAAMTAHDAVLIEAGRMGVRAIGIDPTCDADRSEAVRQVSQTISAELCCSEPMTMISNSVANRVARAAIAAIRKPTRSMTLAPCGEMIDNESIRNLPVGDSVKRGSIFFGPEDATIVWQKMVDAALDF